MVRVNWNVRRKFGRGIEIENWKVGERKKRGYGFWTETGNFVIFVQTKPGIRSLLFPRLYFGSSDKRC